MIEKRLSKKSKKVYSYCKKMIDNNKWEVNSQIPTVKYIAKHNKVSWVTARKAVSLLESAKMIQEAGRSFFVISKSNFKLYNNNRKKFLINSAIFNLKLASITNNKYISFKNNIISYVPDKDLVIILNTISQKEKVYKWKIIKNTINNPKTTKDVLNSKNNLSRERTIWKEQESIRNLSKIIYQSRKKLGINDE